MNHPSGQPLLFERGIEYYITGRYAVFSGLTVIAGTLLHHAIEMLLKGNLLPYCSLKQLRSKFGHDIKKLWSEFKAHSSASLSKFDNVILDLDKFEEIRYPDNSLAHGLALSISPTQGTKAIDLSGKQQQVPHYYLTWEEIDELVKIIFQESSINPLFFTGKYNASAREYLNKENKFSLI
jgi:hypothetical protein